MDFVDRNINYVDEMIIVDDGSSDQAITHMPYHEKIKLYRIKKDYGFNSHGCRNLIMKETSNQYTILMDIDRIFLYPEIAYDILKNKKLNTNTLYRFVAHANMTEAHQSVNDFLISKEHFFSAGGYDEEIIGERWGDREYFKQLLHFGKEELLYGVDMLLTRKPSNYVGGHAKSKHDKPISLSGKKIIERRIKRPEPQKPILTFEWERLF